MKLLQIDQIENESLIRLIRHSMGHLKAGIWQVGLDDREAYFAENFAELLGYEKGELDVDVIDFANEIVHPDDKANFENQYRDSILKGDEFRIDMRLKCKGENYKWFRSTAGIILNDRTGKKIMAGLLIDIDDQKKHERSLEQKVQDNREIRELFEQAQSYAKIGTWEYNLNTNTLFWSEQVYDIHEVEREKKLNVDEAINFYREDFRPVINEAVENCISKQENYDHECVIITAEGREVWVRTMGYAFYENGKMTGLRGLFMDIDAEKRHEIERQFLELKFQSIFNSTYNFIGLMDPDGTLIDVNRTALEFGGFTLETVQGVKVYDTPWWNIDQPTRETLRHAVKKASKGEFIRYDANVVGKNGDIITIDFSISPIFDDSGEVVYLIPEGRDITERKRLEKELQAREEQLRKFVETAPVAVAMFDSEMRYIAVSNEWYTEYGITEDEKIIGRLHYDVFPEIDERKDWQKIHQKALKGETIEQNKDLFIREDGSEKWLNWKVLPWFKNDGEIGGIMMYTLDVSEQIEYQSKLENLNEVLEDRVRIRTMELDRAIKDLESFSYSVSHDLRAPLRSVNSFAEILVEEYSEDLEEEALRYLNIIKDNGVRMGQLIDDILNFSRLGRKEISKSPVNMNSLFDRVIEDTEKHYPNLKAIVEKAELPVAAGDPSLLKQVVTNLINNAFKYSSRNEEIRIRISHRESDQKLIYSISDNGVGFDMKYHDKLFGVFQRLHSENDFSGTGVGLAIVKRIVNKHGGEVWAKSTLNNGSTFYFSLPKK